MRLYALLLVASAALHARAATIPETEKKLIDIVPDNLDKLPENTSSEQELIDQANTIKDVENKLRVKPEDIPVEVIVEDAQPALKAGNEEEEELNRPEPDLRNPGPPQRQEHETQNPEYYASEQQTIILFRQSVNEAQNVLRQKFQGIADSIQNMIGNNEPIQTLQQNILSLRDGFSAQMNKLNATIQSYLNTETVDADKPDVEQTKASFHQIEKGLFKLRNDFQSGMNTLVDVVGVSGMGKADNEVASSGATAVSPTQAPAAGPLQIFQYLQNMQTAVTNTFKNITDTITQTWNPSTTAAPAIIGVQSDAQVTPATATSAPNIWQNLQNQINHFISPNQNQQNPLFPGAGGIGAVFQNGIQNFINMLRPENQAPAAVAGQPAVQPSESASKPSSEAQAEPAKPVQAVEPAAQVAAVTPAPGPIRQMLQNNPITKGITGAVQRLQNINNPEKPRDSEQAKDTAEDKADSETQKGHGGPNNGDSNDSNGSRVEEPKPVQGEPEKLPEPQMEKQEHMKEHKTEEVADKTE
ncbi:uncharacterized protein LOC124636581 [Helicoverpa zea]|uniref:uncharacterized protein LOC124636581 n=1 Tax=Helicoverpa zea TaxID=7113 RepID=UPI001F573F06|nr:uncharacterized protein LOC124636581 [Helicoverpa zea]